MNIWAVTGHLGQNPKLATLPSGTLVLNLSAAVKQRRVKSAAGEWVDQPPIWIDITMFGSSCQWLSERLRKGGLIEAVGELGIREYTARDGTKKTAVEMFASRIAPLDKREDEPRAAPRNDRTSSYQPRSRGSSGSEHEDRGYPDSELPYSDDIPF